MLQILSDDPHDQVLSFPHMSLLSLTTQNGHGKNMVVN